MIEKEVIDILGAGYGAWDGKEGSRVLGWMPTVRVAVQLYQSKAGEARSKQSSSFSLPVD
jgi:hypothetical protein